MVKWVGILGLFGSALFLILSLGQFHQGRRTQERLLRALGRVEPEGDDPVTLKERLWQPLLHYLAGRLAKWAPEGQRNRIRLKLANAGMAGQWESLEWQGLQYGSGTLMALIFFALANVAGLSILLRLELGIGGFFIGYFSLDSLLKARAKNRQREIETTLPDVLDLLTISVEAGLGFDAALMKVVEKQKGVLAEEFFKVLQEIKMGRPRREALRDLGHRNQVEDLSHLVASLVQADQLGISIGGVLRNQARQMRLKRRQRAEEKAQKAPIKMMVPLVLFVFPSVFIVVIGPAIIQIVEMFAKR